MASFLSGLVGSYAGTMIQKHREDRDRDLEKKKAELGVITTAIQTGQLDPASMSAAFARADEIVGELGGGKGKKGGFSLGNLIGKFGDVGGQTQAGAANKGGAPPQQTGSTQGSTAAPAAQPTTQSGLPGAPTGPSASPVSLGTPPGRQPFKPTFQDPNKMAYDRAVAEARGRVAGQAEEDRNNLTFLVAQYQEANPKATRHDVFNNVIAPHFGIEVPKPPTPTADEQKREREIQDIMIADPKKTREQAVREAATNATRKAEGEKPPKTSIGNEAGYPYLKTGDPQKDLAAAQAAFTKGTQIREGERSKADERTARRTAFKEATTTFRQNTAEANRELSKAKATAEAKEKEIRGNSKTITATLLAKNPDMAKANAEVKTAQEKVQRLKFAQNYIDKMSLAVEEGTLDQQAVIGAANEIAEKGFTTTLPPGTNVTRKGN